MLQTRSKDLLRAVIPFLLLWSGCTSIAPRGSRVVSVKREDWELALPDSMSDAFCLKEGVLRDYYASASDWPGEGCESSVRTQTVNCEERYHTSIPSVLKKRDLPLWGGKIGECVSESITRGYRF